MTMIIHQELCQELRSKSLRGAKQEKLAGLILQAVADFQLTPCKMHIISILFYLAGTDKFKILFSILPMDSSLSNLYTGKPIPLHIFHRRIYDRLCP